MKLLFILIFTMILMPKTMAQVSGEKAKSIFLELGGSGGLGSINYEKTISNQSKSLLNYRIGFSLAPIDKNNGTGLVFPLMINKVLGNGTHKMELGLGQGITITTKGQFFALGLANFGYRHQKAESHWFYRANYTPLISYIISRQWQHWAGFSIGYQI
ncbi:MAG: hypothetical protein IT244_09165 [Bacteroidia bacterium]|nr:hypothetical protein [Bacteroidia bacterium]